MITVYYQNYSSDGKKRESGDPSVDGKSGAVPAAVSPVSVFENL